MRAAVLRRGPDDKNRTAGSRHLPAGMPA
jgi:hypothetical protein